VETLTHGFEGSESAFETNFYNRGVTLEQQETKMANLTKLAKEGFIVIRAITHEMYEVKGKDGHYNPYTDTWT